MGVDDFSKNRSTEDAYRGIVVPPKLTEVDAAWFALYVQVNHEKEVFQRLQNKAIESYLPLMERWSKRQDRRKKINTPLFPGYVFIHSALDNQAHVHVLKTPGALCLLKNSEGPLSIPDYQIDNLKKMLGGAEALSLHPYLTEGDWVHVVRGPLEGCTGILIRQNPKKGKLVVSIDIVQRSVSVELSMEDVEPAAPPAQAANL